MLDFYLIVHFKGFLESFLIITKIANFTGFEILLNQILDIEMSKMLPM